MKRGGETTTNATLQMQVIFPDIVINRSQIPRGQFSQKTASRVPTNPLESIRRVTGATIPANVNFTGTTRTKRSEPALSLDRNNIPPPNLAR